MRYLLILLLFIAPLTQAKDYSIGVSQSKMQYCWYGASEACFSYDITVIRGELAFNNNWSIRLGKGINKPTDTQTTITNQVFEIPLTNYAELELIYSYPINSTWNVYGGIGTYQHTVPIYSPTGDLIHFDKDDDEGFLLGSKINLSQHWSVEIFIKQTSKTGAGRGSCDLTCQQNNVAKGSTIRQYGLGILYQF